MQGAPTTFWGKLSPDRSAWHPLVDHCADVAACFEALISCTVLRKRLARLGGVEDLTSAKIDRLAFLAALHDLGKFNRGFQAQVDPARRRVGHVAPTLLLFNESGLREKTFHALDISTLASWTEDVLGFIRILLASISHHGRPVEKPEIEDARIWEEAPAPSPFDGLARLAANARAWFPAAFDSTARRDLLPSNPEFHYAFCGLVTLADWIGSDSAAFPFSSSPAEDRMPFARERAREVLRRRDVDPTAARQQLGVLPSFAETFGFGPRPVQAALEDLPLGETGSTVLLEAETGSGKTEAAFRHFLRLYAKGQVDGLYFALPTRSAAVQIHGRIVAFAQRVFGASAPPVVLAVPGYVRVDAADASRLPGFEVLWQDDDQERARHRGWAAEHPKRFLAAPIVVGTIDQALLSTLQVAHAHLRASALLRHLLVVDEVHASDAYMMTLLEAVLRHHVRAGGHALLMSATLGGAARARLLASRRVAAPPIEDCLGAPYPLISASGSSGGTWAVAARDRQKDVRVEIIPLREDAPGVARLGLEAAHRGGRVLILRNRVNDAIATQEEVERISSEDALLFRCKGIVTIHHGRFAPEDRKSLDDAIEEQFGKRGSRKEGLIVSTQTVEQSLDVDFDFLLTDLCPMDVLLQRVGRVHRHDRARSSGFQEARVAILAPSDRNLARWIRTGGSEHGRGIGPNGLGTVYEDLVVIEATWRLLERHRSLRIPAMNRELVESATHPAALEELLRELGGPWQDHRSKVMGIRYAAAGAAKLNLLRRDVSFDDSYCTFPKRGQLDARIATRLGEDDRLLRFEEPFVSPFSNKLATVNVRSWYGRDCDPEGRAKVLRSEGGTTVIRSGEAEFRYDRFGLRRIDVRPAD